MKEVQFDLPEDIAMQRAQEAHAQQIINSMAFEIFSKNIKVGMQELELEDIADLSFRSVRVFINKAGM